MNTFALPRRDRIERGAMLAAASPQTGRALSQDQIQASYYLLISYFAVMDYSPVLLVVGVEFSITCLVVDSLKDSTDNQQHSEK